MLPAAMKFTLRAAWFLIALSLLLSAALAWLRMQPRSMGTVAIGQDYLIAFNTLEVLCAANLIAAIVVQVRARQMQVRPLALTLIAALLPWFVAMFCEAAGIGGR